MIKPGQQDEHEALKTVAEIEAAFAVSAVALPILLHGVNPTSWMLLDEAIMRGYDIRAGFEDSLQLPGGKNPLSNEALVRYARKRVELLSLRGSAFGAER